MNLDNVFKKKTYVTLKPAGKADTQKFPEVPEGLLKKCSRCGAMVIADEVKKNHYICPECGGYFRLPAYKRIALIADADSFIEWDRGLTSGNPMDYAGYPERVANLKEKTGLDEAVITGEIKINGMPVVVGVMDGRFLMASMGHVVGEKIACAVERATERKLPVILFTCSGGARMQEGITSLMQMAKTSAAVKRHSDAGQLYISVLTDPTTGGVTASFAMLGDIILAEPKALIGFAGQRVIEQTIGQKLPEGFQRAEFLLDHGFVDSIVTRDQLKATLAQLIRHHDAAGGVHGHGEAAENVGKSKADGIAETSPKRSWKWPRHKSAWDRVCLSRAKDRPAAKDYIESMFPDFIELHGDRFFGDDHAIVGGIADFRGIPVTVIAQAKGRSTKEQVECNFGMPSPEGYRKALRLMKQAEKFHRPVICLVDTPGAFCGIEAEERGQGEAIARNIYEMSGLKVPVVSIVIGEGGSGGALAMATADEVWMLENTIYSILSPEGFASILWKDSSRAKEAASVMQLTAMDLFEKGMVEKVISEPEHFTRDNMGEVTEQIAELLEAFLQTYGEMPTETLQNQRYNRFRQM